MNNLANTEWLHCRGSLMPGAPLFSEKTSLVLKTSFWWLFSHLHKNFYWRVLCCVAISIYFIYPAENSDDFFL